MHANNYIGLLDLKCSYTERFFQFRMNFDFAQKLVGNCNFTWKNQSEWRKLRSMPLDFALHFFICCLLLKNSSARPKSARHLNAEAKTKNSRWKSAHTQHRENKCWNGKRQPASTQKIYAFWVCSFKPITYGRVAINNTHSFLYWINNAVRNESNKKNN